MSNIWGFDPTISCDWLFSFSKHLSNRFMQHERRQLSLAILEIELECTLETPRHKTLVVNWEDDDENPDYARTRAIFRTISESQDAIDTHGVFSTSDGGYFVLYRESPSKPHIQRSSSSGHPKSSAGLSLSKRSMGFELFGMTHIDEQTSPTFWAQKCNPIGRPENASWDDFSDMVQRRRNSTKVNLWTCAII